MLDREDVIAFYSFLGVGGFLSLTTLYHTVILPKPSVKGLQRQVIQNNTIYISLALWQSASYRETWWNPCVEIPHHDVQN